MNKLLFTELRIITSEGLIQLEKVSPESSVISKQGLTLALTDQENMRALGYDLKNEGLARLAADYSKNSELTPVYKQIQLFDTEVKASPMYPNFPIQVLEMTESELRTHQLMHYFSTYGMESIFNEEVTVGWLPTTENLIERQEDKHLLDLKILDYVSKEEAQDFVIERLIGRKERLEGKSLELSKAIFADKTRKEIKDIPFKENIGLLYAPVLIKGSVDEIYSAVSELAEILKHPGDLLDLTEKMVVSNRYKHFRTATKRALVDLFESFSVESIEENLASNRWSKNFRGKKGKLRSVNRNVALIDYLSYSRFANNPEAMKVVNDLKDGNLLSWGQLVEQKYTNGELSEVLNLLSQRPGVYFRQLNRLVKNNADVIKMSSDMSTLGAQMKTQSILSAFSNYDGVTEVEQLFMDALVSNLKGKSIEKISNKKVFIDEGQFSLSESKIELSEKSAEGGYIQAGLAIKIPEDVETVRFLTYWNDKRRLDIDLHSAFFTEDGERGHIGYYGSRDTKGFAFSGDITHSDAAEYLDCDLKQALSGGVRYVQFNINSFSRVPFKDYDTVFAGMMAVSKLKEKVKLYDSKNMFFKHDLVSDKTSLDYAYLDVEKRLLYLVGKAGNERNDQNLMPTDVKLSILTYLNILLATQGSTIVSKKEDADIVIGIEKADEENYFSLIDENYFMGE